MKCFWIYLIDSCDHAGIWEVDFELAELFVGEKINMPDIEKYFGDRYVVLKGGKKWFIRKFIDFQYGELNPDNRVHKSIINILRREGALKELKRPVKGRKDQDKDQDMDKDKDIYSKEFENFWAEYPKKIGKGKASEVFEKIKKRPNVEIIIKSVKEQRETLDWIKEDGKYIPHPTTWLNRRGWDDEVKKESGYQPQKVYE